jgi:hypothetical protein
MNAAERFFRELPRHKTTPESMPLSDIEIRRILAGTKTQMRWPVSPQIDTATVEKHAVAMRDDRALFQADQPPFVSPFGPIDGARFIAEAYRVKKTWEEAISGRATRHFAEIEYRADGARATVDIDVAVHRKLELAHPRGWSPAIRMPTWASRRLLLLVRALRIERLQDITDSDAIAEGAQHFKDLPHDYASSDPNRWSMEEPRSTSECLWSPVFAFANHFCKRHSDVRHDFSLWDSNPWVWVATFSVLRPIADTDGETT